MPASVALWPVLAELSAETAMHAAMRPFMTAFAASVPVGTALAMMAAAASAAMGPVHVSLSIHREHSLSISIALRYILIR